LPTKVKAQRLLSAVIAHKQLLTADVTKVTFCFSYIYLSSNEKTGFKSRELKSVHVDAEGRYIRMIIHKNHMNKFNLYNQVGMVNIFADKL